MIKNHLEEEYKLSLEIFDRYQTAKAAEDDDAVKKAREDHFKQEERIEAMGQTFRRLYTRYASAQKRSNKYIDFDDVIYDESVEGLVNAMRECGIEKFVFSSSWSSAVETAWLFQQNGCKLEGLVEINGSTKKFLSDEYEKAHGYLFSVN